jgi:integration host factor subunit beta
MTIKMAMSSRNAEKAVNAFFDGIIQGLVKDHRVELRGFGSFRLKYYKSYLGRNPKSGLSVEVKAKKLPIFRPAKHLKFLLNQD